MLLFLLIMQILTTREALKGPFPKADHRIAYGKGPFQFGDLRLPSPAAKGKGLYPTAIIVHGGCWLAEYDLDYISKLSAALTEKGIATWTIEYRRVGNPGGGVPGTFDDLAAAAAYLHVLAKQYPLDLARTIAVGHSAGGHLALWLASTAPLKGVVSLAGVADLRAAAAQNVCGDAATQLLGDKLDYRRYSPAEMLPLRLPQRLIHGANDSLVPVEMSRAYEAAAKRAGDDVTLAVIPNAGHFELVTPQSAAWQTVEGAVLDLLRVLR
jgi:acetyl esterase/lipase